MKYWNRLPAAVRSAVLRFVRIFGYGVFTSVSLAVSTKTPITWALVSSVVVAAAETAFRAVFPAAQAAPADPSI